MAEIRELVLTFLERLSHNALPKNRKRETLDACIQACYEPRTYRCLFFYIIHAAFRVFHQYIGQYSFCRLTRKNKSLSLTS